MINANTSDILNRVYTEVSKETTEYTNEYYIGGYRLKDLKDWTSKDFYDYLTEQTFERFGVKYQPFGKKYVVDAKYLKDAMEEYGNYVVKEFIDECMAKYHPTKEYPAINFGFMYRYRRNLIDSLTEKNLSDTIESVSKKEIEKFFEE